MIQNALCRRHLHRWNVMLERDPFDPAEGKERRCLNFDCAASEKEHEKGIEFRRFLYRQGELLLFLTAVMGITELFMFWLGKGFGPPYYLLVTLIVGVIFYEFGESEG